MDIEKMWIKHVLNNQTAQEPEQGQKFQNSRESQEYKTDNGNKHCKTAYFNKT